ncbi:hypothetical protein BRC82_00920 [Halobacteriales archaeon QS_1_67_19]|nr:MAG: hypothetical protein BRC82_00920 [Halobacteriales archaeon QS_1_67_19]
MRPIPVMLALLLALSPGAVAFQAGTAATPGASSAEFAATQGADRAPDDRNTTAVLTLGTNASRTAFESSSLSLESSLTMDRGSVRTELSTSVLDQRLENAETPEQKKQILNRFRFRIENRIISLKAEEQQVNSAFSNGSLSATEYLRALARITSEAGEIRTLATAMESHAKSVPNFNMEQEANTIRGKVVSLEGPIRNRIVSTARGEASPNRLFVAASENGVVLATIDDGTYVREIVRTDHRNPGASGQSTIDAAEQSVFERYPWAADNKGGYEVNAKFGTTSVYRLQFQHPHGELTVYFDGGTEQVFKEVQHKRLTGQQSLPPGPSTANTSRNLTVAVNRTYPGGPLRVNVTNATGAPVDARITVAGESVGRTHGDGVLWTLGPAEQFQVSAVHEDATVNVTATPTDHGS